MFGLFLMQFNMQSHILRTAADALTHCASSTNLVKCAQNYIAVVHRLLRRLRHAFVTWESKSSSRENKKEPFSLFSFAKVPNGVAKAKFFTREYMQTRCACSVSALSRAEILELTKVVHKTKMNLADLPDDCIAAIISHTTPFDATRLARVCWAFKRAVEIDTAWENFLPSGYESMCNKSWAEEEEESSSSSSRRRRT